MSRPKSDLASLATLGVGAFGLMKVSKMEGAFQEYAIAQRENHQQMMHGLQTIAELQVASLYMLRDVDAKLTTLSDYFQQKEQKEEFIGDLKLIVRAISKALDEIDHLTETNLEYATLLVEMLQALAKEYDVRIEHFKGLSMADMDFVEEVLERLDNTYRDYMRRLEVM